MFLLNLGYSWKMATDLDCVNGVVILPSSNHRIRVERSKFEKQKVLFDPQLYLAGIQAENCKKTCTRLSTYPWFMSRDIPECDEGISETAWQATIEHNIVQKWTGVNPSGGDIVSACRKCIDYQVSIGCSHIVLPSPIINNRENEASEAMLWLDTGLKMVKEFELTQPILATVALDETTISNDAVFETSGYLDHIVDQYSSRDGIDGVYIVIIQTRGKHPFNNEYHVNRAYLHLSNAFSKAGCETVITNFADNFGLVCMSLGSTGFATGASHSMRRLSWDNYITEGGGHALPHLYSHISIAEYLSETDLDKIVSKKLLRRIYDESPYSQALMKRLKGGGSAKLVADWVESQSNIATAHKHYIFRMSDVSNELGSIVSNDDKQDYVRSWLEDAAANTLYITKKIGGAWKPSHAAPADEWLNLFDVYQSQR